VTEASIAPAGTATVALPPTVTDQITIEILETTGVGFNGVGFAEVEIGDLAVQEYTQMPRTLIELSQLLDTSSREELRSAPIDILMARATDGPTLTSHEELVLRRRFELPDARTFTISGQTTPHQLDEGIVDRLAGLPPGYAARSSSRAFGNLGLRASQTLDGNEDTAWWPGNGGVGEWIEVQVPSRRLDRIVIAQLGVNQGTPVDFISEVRVTINDGQPFVATLRPRRTAIPIPDGFVRRVRIEITDVAGLGGQVGIAELDLGEPRPPAPSPSQPLAGCHPVLAVNGASIGVELRGSVADLVAGRPMEYEGCGPLPLGAGPHLLEAQAGWLVDRVHLASSGGGEQLDPVTSDGPRAVVVREGETELTIAVDGSPEPYFLVIGRSYDSRWEAVRNGLDMGRPELIDGYSVGWRISDSAPSLIEVTYRPQRLFEVALGMSGAILLGCLILLLRTALTRRRSGG
jgi:arabinofuranan 3-O-arabinosyltransferase